MNTDDIRSLFKLTRSKTIRWMVLLLVVWGGQIPWFIYLWISKGADWSILLLLPFYGYMVWGTVKVFRPYIQKPNQNSK